MTRIGSQRHRKKHPVHLPDCTESHTRWHLLSHRPQNLKYHTALQHVRDYPLHIALNILFLAAPKSGTDKTYTQFSSPDSARISFPLPIYTFRPSLQMSKCWNYALWSRMSYFKDTAKVKKRLASIQNVFYSYLDSKPDYGAKLMWAPHIKQPTVGDSNFNKVTPKASLRYAKYWTAVRITGALFSNCQGVQQSASFRLCYCYSTLNSMSVLRFMSHGWSTWCWLYHNVVAINEGFQMEYDDKHCDTAWRKCLVLEVSDNTVECTFLAL